jgi:hypothetical protein
MKQKEMSFNKQWVRFERKRQLLFLRRKTNPALISRLLELPSAIAVEKKGCK